MRRAPSLIQIPCLVAFLLSIVPEQLGQVSDAWQPVPKEDLALKDNPANPGSSAMILERQIYTDDEKRFQTEWVRIKIFNEEGRAYADIEIPYFAKVSTVENIRGRTVRSDGTVIIFNGAVFDKVVAKYRRLRYEAKTFTLRPGRSSNHYSLATPSLFFAPLERGTSGLPTSACLAGGPPGNPTEPIAWKCTMSRRLSKRTICRLSPR